MKERDIEAMLRAGVDPDEIDETLTQGPEEEEVK